AKTAPSTPSRSLRPDRLQRHRRRRGHDHHRRTGGDAPPRADDDRRGGAVSAGGKTGFKVGGWNLGYRGSEPEEGAAFRPHDKSRHTPPPSHGRGSEGRKTATGSSEGLRRDRKQMPARRERIPVSQHHRGLPHGFEAASGQKVRQAAALGGDVDAHR